MAKYMVKCDFCKKVIRMTSDIEESYAGGTCKQCQDDYLKGKGKKWNY